MGGNMGTPPAPSQPPQVNFTTTAESRGGFNNFLKSIPQTTNMTPLPPMGSPQMPPMGGNPMANIDIFNQPMGMMGMNQPQMNPMMQPPMQPPNIGLQAPMMNQQPMMMADGGMAGNPLSGYGDYLSQTIESTQVEPFIQQVQEMASDRFNLDRSQSLGGGMDANPSQSTGQGQNQFGSMTGNFNDPNRINQTSSGYNTPTQGQAIFNNPGMQPSMIGQLQMRGQSPMGGIGSPFGSSLGALRMFAEGGNVPPRRTEIMGQDHMLSYITPEEGGILKALGGAGKPGPMGIPSFYDDSDFGGFSDYSSVDAPSNDMGLDSSSSDQQSTDSSYDDSDPDSDMDYTDEDYGYTTQDTDTGQDDMDRATEIGRDVYNANQAQAQAQAQAFNQQVKNAAFNSQAKKGQLARAKLMSEIDPPVMGNMIVPNVNKVTVRGDQPRGSDIDRDAVQAASNTNFNNIGAKGDQDPLGLSLEGVGLGPNINTPTVAAIGPTSGPGYSKGDVTGFGGNKDGRDVSDFTTADQVEAFSEKMNQAKEGYFPGLEKLPSYVGAIGGLFNTGTKNIAQSVIDNYNKGFAPTYDQKSGQITGTSDYGIGMGMPSSDKRAGEGFGMEQGRLGNLFGTGKTVPGYDVFDATSPSIGMYNRTPADTSGDDGGNDDPLILLRKKLIEEEEENKTPNVFGGAGSITSPVSGPVVVDSPFTSNVGDYSPTGFDSGDLNALIAQLLKTSNPQSMAQGGVAGYAGGGLISAVDNFLASV